MTGHGRGAHHENQIQVNAEVRSVNNRYLKINIISDLDAELQVKVEERVRKFLTRGSVSVRIRVDNNSSAAFQLNLEQLQAYQQQLTDAPVDSSSDPSQPRESFPITKLLTLPGVVEESGSVVDSETLWPVVEKALNEALEQLSSMRKREGESMMADMKLNCSALGDYLTKIEASAPEVVEAFSKRLKDRIQNLLEKFDIKSQPADIIREIGIFAERSDIAEETVRLRSHLAQFDEIMAAKESNGRKLDFLIQEILRETNTIGSKASHAVIAKHVVEIKTLIERLREMVQNVE